MVIDREAEVAPLLHAAATIWANGNGMMNEADAVRIARNLLNEVKRPTVAGSIHRRDPAA